MSNGEAKFVLQAYRPNGRDAHEPDMAAALAQAKNDPTLGAWFAREQAHATVIAAKLRAITPPPGLRDAILAGGRATENAKPRTERRGIATWMGIAATVALLVGVSAALWPRAGLAADEMTAFAFDDVRHGQHGGHGEPARLLQASLSDTHTKLETSVQADLATLERTGCRTLKLAGHDVIEVCFVRDGAEFHCYIGRASDFPSTAGDAATFVQRAGLTAASWSKAGQHVVVVTEAGLDAVKRLL